MTEYSMIDDRQLIISAEGDHHHLKYRCPHCGIPSCLCLKKNMLTYPEKISYRNEKHRCPICHKAHHVNDILTIDANQEFYHFNRIFNLKRLLLKEKIFFYRRFKQYDRLYFFESPDNINEDWISDGRRIIMNLGCFINKIKDPELRKHIYTSSIQITTDRVDWDLLYQLTLNKGGIK